MTDLTIPQWIKLAAGALGVLKAHGADVADLKRDIPKAIGLAKDLHDVYTSVAPAAAQAASEGVHAGALTGGAGTVAKPPAAARATAADAMRHVRDFGLTPGEQAMFDRASSGATG
jgi:hypothetical protein